MPFGQTVDHPLSGPEALSTVFRRWGVWESGKVPSAYCIFPLFDRKKRVYVPIISIRRGLKLREVLGHMISRIWHGRRTGQRAMSTSILCAVPDRRSIPGNKGAYTLRRIEGDTAHFLMVTFWESEGRNPSLRRKRARVRYIHETKNAGDNSASKRLWKQDP